MRTVKPLRMSVLNRVFENAGQPMLTVTAFVGFRLDAPKALQHEVALWKAVQKTWPNQPLDEFMPKTRGEVLAAGSAFVLGGPQPGTNVRITLSRGDKALVDKELVVVGDRTWSALGMGAPEPFEEIPVSWERAFGGEGFADNPRGRGLRPAMVDGQPIHLLPNVEYPKKRLANPSDKPPPASFGPIDLTAPSRMKRAGTYDRRWLDTRFPYYPEDFDWEFFNVAPDDQRFEGFLQGNETFHVLGMHAEKRTIDGALPPYVARTFIEKKSAPDDLVELPMHIDTLFLFPNMLLGVLAFRATTSVEEDDADDVKTLIGAVEDVGAPKPKEHYLRVKKMREDKSGTQLEILDDRPLLPASYVAPEALEEGLDDMAPHVKLEFHKRKRAQAQHEESRAELREQLVAAGLSEEQADAQTPRIDLTGGNNVPSDLSELPEIMERTRVRIEATKARLETSQREEETRMRQILQEAGRDYDKERAEILKASAGPPKTTFSHRFDGIRAELEAAKAKGLDVSAQEAKLNDPGTVAEMRELDILQLSGYRQFGHLKPVGPDPLDPAASRARIDEARARLDRGESLRGFDFTGVDFNGVDLRGVDLSQAMFESARFAGGVLAGANLSEAMLGRASLDGGDFTGAVMRGANLSKSTFRGAVLDGCDLASTTFHEADLDGGSFKKSSFETVTFLQTRFGAVDFTGAKLRATSVIEGDLSACIFRAIETDQVSIIKSRLDRADFTSSSLLRTSFVMSHGEGVSFVAATFERVGFAGDCKLPKADFKGASMKHVCLRGTVLTESDFSGARADDCDFSAVDLKHGKLYRLHADRSLFVRTDLSGADMKGAVLMNAVLQKARIYGTDFRGANLFRADLSKVRGDTATDFRDAYLAQITMAGSLSEQKAQAKRPEGLS